MRKAEISAKTIELDHPYEVQAIELVNRLSSTLPAVAIVAIDCMPNNGQLNPFHYVNGRTDLCMLLSLVEDIKQQDDIKSKLIKSEPFAINFHLGIEAGLWQKIDLNDYEEKISWDNAFVIKKINGEMMIYDPALNNKRVKGEKGSQELKHKGSVTKTNIIKFIHRPGKNFYQPYFTPLPGPQSPNRNTSYRLFIYYTHHPATCEFLGGIWISRYNLRLKNENQARIGLITK